MELLMFLSFFPNVEIGLLGALPLCCNRHPAAAAAATLVSMQIRVSLMKKENVAPIPFFSTF
jgi:hypothetical protein